MSRVGLITVVSGEAYERYAHALRVSARDYFLPGHDVQFFMLAGRDGWPAATLYRYHVILDHRRWLKDFDYLYLCDADMRFEDTVSDEILGTLVATIHPGYVTTPRDRLPFETNPASRAYLPRTFGRRYYAGGFIGGEREAFLWLADLMAEQIDEDKRNGVLATWHDESHLNAVLARRWPDIELSPAYAHPDQDDYYLSIWPEAYERKLVALDKTADERSGR